MERKRLYALFLLTILAFSICVFAYAQVCISFDNDLPKSFFIVSLCLFLLVLSLCVVVSIKFPYCDPHIIPLTVLLNGIGLTMIYRLQLTYTTLYPVFRSIAKRQLQWTVISIIVVIVVMFLIKDHRILRKWTYIPMVLGLVLLLLPLVPIIGNSEQGSQIWIKIYGVSFQPAELSKLLLAIFFANYLITNRDRLAFAGKKFLFFRFPRIRDLGPILIAWLISLALLVFERDLGTSLLFFSLFVGMLFVATGKVSWIFIGLTMFCGGVYLAYRSFGHVRVRFAGWLHPFSNELYNKPVGGSSQLVKGLFGMANGGIFGTGLGQGRPYITDLAFSDFIYTSLAEELGLVGACLILLALFLLIQRGFIAGLHIVDGFGKLLSAGISLALATQVFVVVGGVTRVIPVTGMTLPFLASGGSSLIVNWVIIGLLIIISNDARRPALRLTREDLSKMLEKNKTR